MHLGIFPNYCIFETGIVVRNTLVTYDRGNDKVGFWKTNCSELWRRLQLPSVPAPPPSISSSNDSSIGMPPRLAPDGLPLNVLPGRITLQNVVGLFGSLKYWYALNVDSLSMLLGYYYQLYIVFGSLVHFLAVCGELWLCMIVI